MASVLCRGLLPFLMIGSTVHGGALRAKLETPYRTASPQPDRLALALVGAVGLACLRTKKIRPRG